jgi:gliding-associated putative ABC transporter substrate-binding component GldG
MNTKKTQALVRLALVFGIVVLVNFISVRLFARLDLTSKQIYTLSDASKTLVGNLDDRVTVKAYFTEDLPAPYNNNRRAVLDILNDYKAYAGGNLHFEFINPEGERGEEEAQREGISPVQVQVVKEDRLEVKRGYLGLAMYYEDRKEVLPVVQNLASLEYDISSALKRLTNRTRKRIGYTTGHGEPDASGMARSHQAVEAQYDLVPVDLGAGNPVPVDLAALLVISPQRKLSDSAQYAIDQFVMHGGKVAFLLNKMNATLQSRVGQPIDLGLEGLLEHYGIRLNADLVRDAQCANVSVMQQQGPFTFQSQVPFPYLPIASNFSDENVIVKDLQSVIFHFVSSLDTSPAAARGVRAEVLARSSSRSGRQSGFLVINPFQQYTAADLAESGIPMAAVLEGSFSSYFSEKTVGDRQPAGLLTNSPETRIVVVGDGDFMKDEYLGQTGNLVFFANIVDYLADDAGLITIRSKNVAMPPLEQVSDGTRNLLKYGNLALPPLLVMGYGLLRWQRRRSLKRALESKVS